MTKTKYKAGEQVVFKIHPDASNFTGMIIQRETEEHKEDEGWYDILLFNQWICMHEDDLDLLDDRQEDEE